MQTPTTLKTGSRYRSQACATEIIVVRPGSRPVSLSCGGHPVTDLTAPAAEVLEPNPVFLGGTGLGKRYTHPDDDNLEILVTKAGTGALSDGTTLLVLKEAKPLPASD
jgi:hypothetical protein